jgi:amino acid transporter
VFFTVSGGPYGLEPLVAAVGPGWAVILIVLTPLLWGLPIALMAAELAGALPEEGGYYVWVREALGEFWGVQEGWWRMGYTAVDMAIYPVLFVDYLAFFVPSLAPGADGSTTGPTLALRWLIAACLIGLALTLNARGARAVGGNATVSVVLVLVPFALVAALGLGRAGAMGAVVRRVGDGLADGQGLEALALGLATVLWNFCGWDNVSTFAGEVEDPRRNYPRAFAVALPLIVAAYLLPVLAGIATTTDPAGWGPSAGWPALAAAVGGHGLGTVVAAGALLSAWSLFNSQLLYASRLPYAMARDGWLPAALARTTPRAGIPMTALMATGLAAALLAALPFGALVIVDILLYSAALALEFVALIVLRARQPELPRPFRVPGGRPALVLVTLCPLGFAAAMVRESLLSARGARPQLAAALAMMSSGVVIYVARRARAGPRSYDASATTRGGLLPDGVAGGKLR